MTATKTKEERMAALEERIGEFEAMLRDPITLAGLLLDLLRELQTRPVEPL